MTRTHVSMPSLVHGVSQLSAAERQPVHALACDNCWPLVDKGSQKRPPLIHVKKLQSSSFGDAYCHGIDRGSGEQYMALLRFGATTANGLVFDTSGAVYVVKKNTGSYASPDYATNCDYLYLTSGSNPTRTIRALSVLDYTFIVNRNYAVTMANTTTTAAPTTVAHVFIRQAAFGMRYAVRIKTNTVDTTVYAVTHDQISAGAHLPKLQYPVTGTDDGCIVKDGSYNQDNSVNSRSSVKTEDIAEALLQRLNGGAGAPYVLLYGVNTVTVGKLTVTRVGSVLKIVSNDGAITEFKVYTSQGDQLAFGIQNETSSFTNLPLVFTHDYVVKIVGSAMADEDDFWVKFTADTGSGFGSGTWSETNKPGITYTWTYTASGSQPHVLVRRTSSEAGTATNPVVGNSGKFFTFEPMNLGERLVGDTDSNPNPSFVSVAGTYQPAGGGGTVAAFPVVRKVQDVAFFRDRLIFCCDESLSCSEQGQYFNFFRTTVRAVPDSDPIDVAISGNRTTVYHGLAPMFGKLVCFADKVQSQFFGQPNLTPSTVEGTQVSQFQTTPFCAPQPYKDGILYPAITGAYTTLRSLYPKSNTENVFDSDNLSIHTPSYVVGNPKQLEVNSDSSVIAMLCDGDTDGIYILKQHREGDRIIQSAWVRFVIDGATIRGIKFFDEKLYVVTEHTNTSAGVGLFLGYIDLSAGVSDGGRDYWLMLDRRVTNATSGVSTSFGAGVTTVTMPYEMETGATYEVVNTSTLVRYTGTVTGLNTFTVPVDITAASFVAGKKYTSTHSFHKPEVQINAENGRRLILDSTSAVVALELRYENTGYFKVVTGSQTKSVGVSTSYTPAGTVTEPKNGTVVVGVGGRLDSQFDCSVQNDTPFPHSLVSGEWILNVNVRSPALR